MREYVRLGRQVLGTAAVAAGLLVAMPLVTAGQQTAFAADKDALGDIDQQLEDTLAHKNKTMIKLAATNPDAFIGKTLFFINGKKVGKVDGVKRWKRDHNLYLVVAAKPFFNEDVQYAVPVSDLKEIKGDKVLMREDAGKHLRGMEYYASDYSDVNAGAPIIVDK